MTADQAVVETGREAGFGNGEIAVTAATDRVGRLSRAKDSAGTEMTVEQAEIVSLHVKSARKSRPV